MHSVRPEPFGMATLLWHMGDAPTDRPATSRQVRLASSEGVVMRRALIAVIARVALFAGSTSAGTPVRGFRVCFRRSSRRRLRPRPSEPRDRGGIAG